MWCGPGNRAEAVDLGGGYGEGIDEDKLEKIKRALKEGDGSGVGIGLGNIARRLKAMYEDGEVRIESRKGCATVVQLAFTPENCKEDEP